MDSTLRIALKQLGCNDKQARLYFASLNMGAATLPDLAKAAHLQRSTAYVIAAELVDSGLLGEDHKTYRKLYLAVDPEVVAQKLAAKHRQMGRANLALQEALPELRAAHRTSEARPRVRTYEGKNGLYAILKDILQEQHEVLIWTNQAAEQAIFDPVIHDRFIAERIRKRIPARVLAVRNTDGAQLISGDGVSFRQTKLLPPEVIFTSETYIYGNKVAVLDVGKNIFGVITENRQIAASHRAVFELAWRTSASS